MSDRTEEEGDTEYNQVQYGDEDDDDPEDDEEDEEQVDVVQQDDDEDDEEEDEDEEYEEEYEEEEDDEDVQGVVQIARGRREEEYDEDDEDEDADDEEVDDEYNADEDFASLEARASDLAAEGLSNEAIQVLKVLTPGLVSKLPELDSLDDRDANQFRTQVLGTLALWIEVLRDGKGIERYRRAGGVGDAGAASLIESLNTWRDAFLQDENLDLTTDNVDEDDEDEDDVAIVKEFIDLLDDLKQPVKKKHKGANPE